MDIEKEIRKILWGKAIVEAKNNGGIDKTYILRSLTIKEQNELDFIYEKSLQEALDSNVLLNKDLESFYLINDIWGEEHENQIIEAEKLIKKLESNRLRYRVNKTKLKIVDKKLVRAKEELSYLVSSKSSLFAVSAEHYADEISNRYMIYMSATDEDDKAIWQDKNDFLNSDDVLLIYNLTVQYIRTHILNEGQIRKIARSGSWRYRWSVSKNGESLFGKSIAEWSQLQNNLVYWSQYYDYVYEATERPDDFTIEDDLALDKWMENQSRKNNKSVRTKKKIKDGEFVEEFIMVEDGDNEAIKDAYDQNTLNSKRIIEQTNKKIKEKGRVSEWDAKKEFRNTQGEE